MPIVVALIVLGLLIYGAWWSFTAIAAHFGLTAAIVAAVIAAGIVIAGIMRFIASRREIAPNVPRGSDGNWTHELKRDWGGVRLAAQKGLCNVRVGDEHGQYIFADLRGAHAQDDHVLLDVRDARHAQWRLPLGDRREARKWARILSLATRGKL